MRRSLLSSIFCFISLLLITFSYFFISPLEISRLFVILFFGLLFSLGFLVPAIYAYYKEERVKTSSRMFLTNQPVGHTFSLLCGIPTIIFGFFFHRFWYHGESALDSKWGLCINWINNLQR